PRPASPQRQRHLLGRTSLEPEQVDHTRGPPPQQLEVDVAGRTRWQFVESGLGAVNRKHRKNPHDNPETAAQPGQHPEWHHDHHCRARTAAIAAATNPESVDRLFAQTMSIDLPGLTGWPGRRKANHPT